MNAWEYRSFASNDEDAQRAAHRAIRERAAESGMPTSSLEEFAVLIGEYTRAYALAHGFTPQQGCYAMNYSLIALCRGITKAVNKANGDFT